MRGDHTHCVRCGAPHVAPDQSARTHSRSLTAHAAACPYARSSAKQRGRVLGPRREKNLAAQVRAAEIRAHEARAAAAERVRLYRLRQKVEPQIRAAVHAAVLSSIRARLEAAAVPLFLEGTERTKGAAAAIAVVNRILDEIERGDARGHPRYTTSTL